MRGSSSFANFANSVGAAGAFVIVAAALGATAWIGCSSDSATPATVDGGASDGSTGSDTSMTGDTGGGNDAASDTGTPLAVSCENYCSLVMLNCTGQNAEYINKDTCLSMCATMTQGTLPDTTNDTVACRQSHAGAAQASPSAECPSAGPTGGDTCGTSHCAAWCALDIARCGTIAYANQAACVTACAAFAYNKSNGDIAQTTGATMNCRIYHVEAAYQNDGGLFMTHCPHTGSPSVNKNDGGAGPCN